MSWVFKRLLPLTLTFSSSFSPLTIFKLFSSIFTLGLSTVVWNHCWLNEDDQTSAHTFCINLRSIQPDFFLRVFLKPSNCKCFRTLVLGDTQDKWLRKFSFPDYHYFLPGTKNKPPFIPLPLRSQGDLNVPPMKKKPCFLPCSCSDALSSLLSPSCSHGCAMSPVVVRHLMPRGSPVLDIFVSCMCQNFKRTPPSRARSHCERHPWKHWRKKERNISI